VCQLFAVVVLKELDRLRFMVFDASLFDQLLNFLDRVNDMDSFTTVKPSRLQNPYI